MPIQDILQGKDDKLDVDQLLAEFPWVIQENVNCILSPDSDGLLCGLFMSHFLNWKIVGFYDGKTLLLKEGVSCYSPNTVFLDVDIYRKGVRSIGHHMVLFNRRQRPASWGNFSNCIQPNILRDYDKTADFRIKYPLATIHLLLALLGSRLKVQVTEESIPALLFTDGTFNVVYGYPENVLNWLNYLNIDDVRNPLRTVFMHEYTMYDTMLRMDQFFRERDKISVPRERGDRLKISDNRAVYNTCPDGTGLCRIQDSPAMRAQRFIRLLAEYTGWKFVEQSWAFGKLRTFQFTKSDFTGKGWNATNDNFARMISLNPLSWAITSGTNVEFTVENPSILP
jgi:hypothetical protein